MILIGRQDIKVTSHEIFFKNYAWVFIKAWKKTQQPASGTGWLMMGKVEYSLKEKTSCRHFALFFDHKFLKTKTQVAPNPLLLSLFKTNLLKYSMLKRQLLKYLQQTCLFLSEMVLRGPCLHCWSWYFPRFLKYEGSLLHHDALVKHSLPGLSDLCTSKALILHSLVNPCLLISISLFGKKQVKIYCRQELSGGHSDSS